MKDFLKMVLACIVAFIIVSILPMLIIMGIATSFSSNTPVAPREAVLKIDMSTLIINEQREEDNPFSAFQGKVVHTIGIYDAVNAINAAAKDPAIKFLYLKPDGAQAGMAHFEELRVALTNFRNSGKAVISYTESPTNGGYYLASASDKVYMTKHEGGMNMFNGVSSQMIFLKDVLDKLGVNVQLIRHGKYKSAGEMYVNSTPSPENTEQNLAMIQSIWSSWSNQIAQSRNITTSELNEMLDNLALNFPKDFVEHKLVDELVTRDELKEKMVNLYSARDFSDVNMISLPNYIKIQDTKIKFKPRKVAVIFANGNIVDGEDIMNISGDRFAEIISEVRRDKNVEAVVLRVNSPGGSVLASEKIKNELDLIKGTKPLIASYGNYAASGGYWISNNCDYIYSNSTTLTGSIGVFSMIPDFSKTVQDKLHMNIASVKSNKHADIYSLMRPLDKSEVAYMQASVESIYDRFTSIVAEGRNLEKTRVNEIAQGRVWSGTEAKEISLVDSIGTLEDAIAHALSDINASIDEVNIVAYPTTLTSFEILLQSLEPSDQGVFSGTALENVEQAFKDWSSADYGKVYARMPYIYDFK